MLSLGSCQSPFLPPACCLLSSWGHWFRGEAKEGSWGLVLTHAREPRPPLDSRQQWTQKVTPLIPFASPKFRLSGQPGPEAIPKLTLSLAHSPGFAHSSVPTYPAFPSSSPTRLPCGALLLPGRCPHQHSHTYCAFITQIPNIDSCLYLGIPSLFLEYQIFFFTFSWIGPLLPSVSPLNFPF